MMRRPNSVIAAALLLCAVKALCCHGVEKHACVRSWEVECFLPASYLNGSDPVDIKMSAGKKLIISLEGLSGYSVCHWARENDPVMTTNGTNSTVFSSFSETVPGTYTLTCENKNETRFSKTVVLSVMERPTKPQLTLNGENEQRSPSFMCNSEGSPKPVIQWSRDGKAESTVSSTNYYKSGVMCCATNDEGQECTQLHDYDVGSSSENSDEVSDVTVSPGESLLLRCRIEGQDKRFANWTKDGKTLDDGKQEMRIKKDKLYDSLMTYLFIRSVSMEHSGMYTCTSPKNKTKPVRIQVKAESFLSAQLDDTMIVTAQNVNSISLQAKVSYHPVLRHCYWEAPDTQITKCIREEWVTKHRTVKLCNPLKSGVYKLYLEAGGIRETENVTVCVVDTPEFKLKLNKDDTVTYETATLVPANFTWMACSSFNDSCETDSSWEVFLNGHQPGSEDFCNKTITSSVKIELVAGKSMKFCVTNSVGSWCDRQMLSVPSLPQTSKSFQSSDNSLMLLKIGSFLLLLALVLVMVALAYFVKKKKPQYQPQLQMIQMLGPNDNDYIYINFKDFEYDKKWEFPRENLKLGNELGSGAFGTVLQATAYGINKPGVSHQVAVKMLKEKHQSMEKEALMSELKMLTHIGHHDNIVNLLGACTDSGPIYLIFQYCCYGDLLNYLKKNSDRYHKSVTDAINRDRFRNLYSNLQVEKNSSESVSAVDNYVPMHGSSTRGQEDIALLTLSYMESTEDSETYDSQDDQTEDVQAITFGDLLSFAFQVAKGMEFLSSKNCIHRDLAARNVLVTKDRLVKIGDFGLARDIDNDSNYVVRGNVRLPVKWMAPESIFQGMYTMKSDVWAYGILLWEIFSLGVTPYPGVKVDHTFYSMIERGFKMECPYYANEYGMMCKCWALDPCNRPSFSKLVSFMYDQLTDVEEKLYHNMIDQTSSDYQNAQTILDVSALTKQEDRKAPPVNDYCRAYSTEESKAGESNLVAVAVEEELLKPSHTE
ncbi:receptor-type tyrosine-protein kinase FLT3-like isoform 2-T2 [Odontesthes bonariensis]|uniref:receptor-type tyrosine-protein kinase FLT3-like isoform X2 n=1 Tax=Odontesthes bonariensis TaxID=219752 RepID=UPI003F58B580